MGGKGIGGKQENNQNNPPPKKKKKKQHKKQQQQQPPPPKKKKKKKKKKSPPSMKLLDSSRAARVVRGNPSVIVGQWTGRIALCTRCYRDHVSLCLPHKLCVCRSADALCTASREKRIQLFKLRRLITNETVFVIS